MHTLFLRKLLPNQLIRNHYSWGNLRVRHDFIECGYGYAPVLC